MTIQVDSTKKTQGVDTSNLFSQAAPIVDKDMTMEGSIFNKTTTESDAKKAKEGEKKKDSWLKKTFNAAKNAKSEISGCKDMSKNSKVFVKDFDKQNKNIQNNTNKTVQLLTKNNQIVKKAGQEIQVKQAEIATLTEKRASIEAEIESASNTDSTGSNEGSAFSLQLAGSQNENSQNPSTASPSNNSNQVSNLQQELAGVEGQINNTQSVIKTNTVQITTTANQSNSFRNDVNRLITESMKYTAQTQNTITEGQQKASTAQTIGTTATTVGGLATAVGGAMIATGYGAPLGVKIVLGGTISTVAGSITTAVSQTAQGDLAGAAQSAANATTQTANAANTIKQIQQPPTTTPPPSA